jgi:formate hydrogenlyase subunit 6/NADH:ubiquinone oxidoreductase subunit I
MMVKNLFRRKSKRDSTPTQSSTESEFRSNFRGQPLVDVNLCIGCGTCAKECPSKSITLVEFEGKKHPMFHLDSCLFCYQCAESCPQKAIIPSTSFELATTDKKQLAVDPQICTFSIKLELDKKSEEFSDIGTFKKKMEEDEV